MNRAYIDIIRWKNIIMLIFIQCLMQFSVVSPLLKAFGFNPDTTNCMFFMLVLATAFITAGGYVINDYFDVKIDRINSPERVIVGKSISRSNVMRYYQILTTTGLILGILLSIISKSLTLGLIFILTPGLLWFYSASYKRQFLIGNLLVALLAALSVFMVAILAVAQLKEVYQQLLTLTPVPKSIYGWVGGFSLFAFLLTFVRELVKDMEDINGDKELECRTLPIVLGISKTKILLYCLTLFIILTLMHVNHHYFHFDSSIPIKYMVLGIIIPLLLFNIMIFKAKESEAYHQASTLSKLIMLIGVLFSLVFYYLMAQKFGFSIFGLFTVPQ